MARISELHYSNAVMAATGIQEYLEVALTDDEAAEAANYYVGFYDDDGTLLFEIQLDDSAISPVWDADAQEWVYVIDVSISGMMLTDPATADEGIDYTYVDATTGDTVTLTNVTVAEAYSLTYVDPNTGVATVIDFYEIGAGDDVTAIGGAADGATSTNIDVASLPNGTEDPDEATGTIQFNVPEDDIAVVEDISPGDSGMICFLGDVLISTPSGQKRVDSLKLGDLVLTKDSGPQPVKWIGRRKVSAKGTLAPIVFTKGAIGNSRELCVSPEHRILLGSAKTEILFGETEVLVPAKHLVNGDTIFAREGGEVEYIHFACSAHEIVFANGIEAETFLPSEYSLSCLTEDARDEFLKIFPEFISQGAAIWQSCKPTLNGFEARIVP